MAFFLSGSTGLLGRDMYQMEKISTGIAYGTSAGSAGYWFLQWLDQVSPSQWAAIGVLGSLVICIIVCLSWAVNHYRDNAIAYKALRDKNARELKLANAAITDMQMRQRDVAALDAKYTKELADAKAENDALRDDVAAGRRRLHIKAVCQSVREATTASGVDNAASPRLADTAERDYFTLRERLITMQKQLEGTQKYINEQCR